MNQRKNGRESLLKDVHNFSCIYETDVKIFLRKQTILGENTKNDKKKIGFEI
jgi:hypothetical protein